MVKEKAKEHGLEYVILNDDESELWEIDYDTGHAANVSEYVQIDSLKHDSIVKYFGRIEDFLSEQKNAVALTANNSEGRNIGQELKN